MALRFFSLISFLIAAGCSTVNPGAVPEFETVQLPSLRLKGFRSVDLIVLSSRSANEAKGNSVELVEAVKSALTSSLKRGGIRVNKDSTNKLRFLLEDCQSEDGPECVSVSAMLRTSDLNVEVEGTSKDPQRAPASKVSKKSPNKTPELKGMNKSYYVSLKSVIDRIPPSLKRALEH